MKSIFPDPRLASEDGLLTVGGFVTPEILIDAYTNGIFPWPVSIDLPLAWFSPDPRGIITLDQIKISKNVLKAIKQTNYSCKFNTCFEDVIKSCATHHSKNFSRETWITPEMIKGYLQLHHKGHAYSIETFNEKNELVGGLYGVNINGFFSGESMFFKEDNASKFALYSLIIFLHELNFPMLDIQMVTPITERFGGEFITRDKYLDILSECLKMNAPILGFNR
tara:strand:+ start:18 stop:686 length:669 start_codon:yes stop_codon:yes gene_type:complete